DGTATAPSDYVAVPLTTVTIPPKTILVTVDIKVKGDIINEPNETFFVNLSAPTNATIADAQGQGTIVNDDDTQNPNVTVISPNGGEIDVIGTTVKLAWSANDNVGVTSVDLLLSRSGVGGPYETIQLGVPNTGTYVWTVTGPASSHAILKVVA